MNAILKAGKFLICLSITYALIALYAHTASKTGVLQTMMRNAVDDKTLIFSIAASIPLVIILFWPLCVRRSEIFPLSGVMLNRWRSGALGAVISLVVLQVLL